MVSILKV